ncbi:MAG: DUF1844 domain-containing protein [Holophagales bacterium]|jgi:hypothetical protein|nr:DUF1844 domain-containing protein [Holophagales bacterium]MBK9966530.1 DUF1844 domain-containing protein [Holophagales bacterium]
MSEAPRTIKVVDRRMFTAEGDLRDDVMEELSTAPPAPPASPDEAAPAPPPEEVVPTSPAFLRLLDMLAQTASMYLQGIPDPATGRRSVDLAASREIIDSLVALREKTRGRLSFEETDSLEGLLGELQMVFTRLAAQAKGAPGMPPPPRPRG